MCSREMGKCEVSPRAAVGFDLEVFVGPSAACVGDGNENANTRCGALLHGTINNTLLSAVLINYVVDLREAQ